MNHPLHVSLLHNYRDEQQPSMRLYANRLGDSLLQQNLQVTRVRPPAIVPEAWLARSKLWAKLDGYFGRFAVYPRLVKNLPGDIVHVIDHGQGYLLGSLDPRRTVVTCHDVILLTLASGRIGSVRVPPVALQLFRLSVEFMKRAAAIVADSEQTRRDLTDVVGVDPEKIRVIHPGLNQPFSSNPDRGLAFRRAHKIGDGLLALQIGRGFYKNIPGVLRILQRVRKQGIDVRLVRTGRPLAGEELVLAERLGVAPFVVELRGVPDSDLPALYNAVDLLLFPSLYEGFGWPPLEAMASGTPVVSSRAGSLDEIVGDAALTADPEDAETLAWHAASVLTDQALRTRVIRRGKAWASEFQWSNTATRMIELYRQVRERAA